MLSAVTLFQICLVSRPGNLACVAATLITRLHSQAKQAHLDFPVVCQVQVWMVTFLLCHFGNLTKELHSCKIVHISD